MTDTRDLVRELRIAASGYPEDLGYKVLMRSAAAALESAERDARRYRLVREAKENDAVLFQDYPAGYGGSAYMMLEIAWKAERWVRYTPELLDNAIDAALAPGDERGEG